MERFLRYSLEKQRPIRMIYLMENGGMRQLNAQIIELGEKTVCFTSLRPKGDFIIDKASILSADYKKGDEGQE